MTTKEAVIQAILKKNKGKTYFEIGAKNGDCFGAIKCRNKIGIDPIPMTWKMERAIKKRGGKYFQMDSDTFFKKKARSIFKNNKLDLALVDGLHHYNQVIKDVKNCLGYLNQNGFIVLHDCNPTTKEMQIVPRIQGVWTGDSWKALIHFRTFPDLNVFVLDCDYGVGIVTKGTQDNQLQFTLKDIKKMTYGHLVKDRTKMLNLKKSSYLNKFLKERF